MESQIKELESLNKFIVENKNPEYTDIIKQWNEYFKNLTWYQKNVESSNLERARKLAQLMKNNSPKSQIESVFGAEQLLTLKPFMPAVTSAVQEKLKIPSTGLSAVARWQRIIGIEPDGQFGPATAKKTMSWQKAHGLVADGIVGPKTWTKAGVTPPLETIRQTVGAKVPANTSSSSSGQTTVAQSPKPQQTTVYTPVSSSGSTVSSIIPKLASLPLWAGLGLLGALAYSFFSGKKTGATKWQDERWDDNER